MTERSGSVHAYDHSNLVLACYSRNLQDSTTGEGHIGTIRVIFFFFRANEF